MGARRLAVAVVLALAMGAVSAIRADAAGDAASYFFTARQGFIQAPSQHSTAPDAQSQEHESSSSNKTSHRKNQAVHHTRVEEEVPPAPELTKAEELIQKRDYAAAEPLLHKVVEGDPGNYVAWFDLGFVENGLGKVDDSIAAYRKSVAAKPDVFESNLNLGLQLAKTNQPDAEHFLHAATQLKPTSHVPEGQARAWLSLAHVLEPANPDEALAAYRQAAVLQPKNAEPHVAAGLLLEKQNKFSEAEQEYKTAVALDPSSDALTGLANLYMRGRRFPEAEAALRKLVAAHPEEAAARIQLGRVLAAEGKNDDAIAELEAGQKLAPTDVSLQRDLADLYWTAGKNAQAEAAYRTLVAGHPNDAELHHSLGKSLLRQKKFADAQQEFLTAVKLKPDFGEAYGDLAFAASENKDYALTIKALEARRKFLADVPITYFLRATAYDNLWEATGHGNSYDRKQAIENYHLFLKAANGKYPDQEWQAQHRLIAMEPKK